MMAETCTLGEVLAFGTEGEAMAVAKKAALEVDQEELFSVRVEKRGDAFLPLLSLRRRTSDTGARELSAEVIVDRVSLEPCGLFIHARVDESTKSGPYVEAWEEDLSGMRRGPIQMLFLPYRKNS
ncbi:MAG: hypothetical protein U0136_08085 [Bdellovibrionota bacterium]